MMCFVIRWGVHQTTFSFNLKGRSIGIMLNHYIHVANRNANVYIIKLQVISMLPISGPFTVNYTEN